MVGDEDRQLVALPGKRRRPHAPAARAASAGGGHAVVRIPPFAGPCKILEPFASPRPSGDGRAEEMPSDSAPATLAGQQLGPYVLREQIGAGGMGEVYRARDARLGRDVAIKLLPSHLAADADRRERFEREARLLAALNHPYIASVYGLEEGIANGRPISGIVLELVEGGTLAERLRRGALPRAEAVKAARQIAQALDAAHDKGIIHRDLKPANVALTPDGDVRILDFGLGRWAAPPGEPSRDTTVTEPGLVLGTAGYMSPEQARGSVVDKRTDIWAFGCVLYEMLTGRAPFAAATVLDMLSAVLDRDPDWTAVPAGTPVTLSRLLRRCLEKDPNRRLRDIGDAIVELEDASAHPAAPDPMGRPADSRPRAWWPVASALAVAVAAWLLWPAPAPPNVKGHPDSRS
jgi:eukaryotic-like serine/threonine-protein kinase